MSAPREKQVSIPRSGRGRLGPTIGGVEAPVGLEEEYAAWRRTPQAAAVVALVAQKARQLSAKADHPVAIASAITDVNVNLAFPISLRFATRIRGELAQHEGHGLQLPKGVRRGTAPAVAPAVAPAAGA